MLALAPDGAAAARRSCCSATCSGSRAPTSPPPPCSRSAVARRAGGAPPPARADARSTAPAARSLGAPPARWERALLALLAVGDGRRRAGARQPAARRARDRARGGGAAAHAAPAGRARARRRARRRRRRRRARALLPPRSRGGRERRLVCRGCANFRQTCDLGFRHAIIRVMPVRDSSISSAVEDYAKAIYALERPARTRSRPPHIAERLGRHRRVRVGDGAQAVRARLVVARALQGRAADRARGRGGARGASATTGCWSSTWPRPSGSRGTACTPRPRCSSTSSPRSSRTLIAAKLGNPTHDPHGDPIPTRDLVIEETPSRALSALEPGATGTFVRISDSDPAMLRYLAERGIAPGDALRGHRAAAVRRAAVRLLRRRGPRARRPARRRDARARSRRDARRPRLLESALAPAARRAAARQRAARDPQPRRRPRPRSRMLGPAFVAAVAYIDPGNFATNIAGGAKYGFLLVWVIIAANLMAMLVQYLSAKVGIATGRSLPELCRERFPRPVDLGPVGAGGDHRDRDRPGRVRRRGDRAQPAVRRAAVRRRPDHRGRRVRDPRAADARLPPLRAGDRRAARDRAARLRLRPARTSASTRRVRRRPRSPASTAPTAILLAVGILGATVMPHVVYLHSALTQAPHRPRTTTSSASCCASSAST